MKRFVILTDRPETTNIIKYSSNIININEI